MLSETQIKDYFLKHFPSNTEILSVDFIDIGNINFVYKINSSKGIFYLKYGLDHERKKTAFTDHFSLRESRLKRHEENQKSRYTGGGVWDEVFASNEGDA